MNLIEEKSQEISKLNDEFQKLDIIHPIYNQNTLNITQLKFEELKNDLNLLPSLLEWEKIKEELFLNKNLEFIDNEYINKLSNQNQNFNNEIIKIQNIFNDLENKLNNKLIEFNNLNELFNTHNNIELIKLKRQNLNKKIIELENNLRNFQLEQTNLNSICNQLNHEKDEIIDLTCFSNKSILEKEKVKNFSTFEKLMLSIIFISLNHKYLKFGLVFYIILIQILVIIVLFIK